MPGGATAYDENASGPNAAAGPAAMASEMGSPLHAGQGAGVDLRYMAQRAAAYLKSVKKEAGSSAMHQEMERMQTDNPNLYKLVVQLMADGGSRQDPGDPMKSPVTGTGHRDPSRQV